MSAYQESTLNAYRDYAKKRCGELAEALTETELLKKAALAVLRTVGDCASEADAVRLFEGGRLLGIQGQDKEALDSLLVLWELAKPDVSARAGEKGTT